MSCRRRGCVWGRADAKAIANPSSGSRPRSARAFVLHDVFDVPFGHHAALVRRQRRSHHAHRRDPHPENLRRL